MHETPKLSIAFATSLAAVPQTYTLSFSPFQNNSGTMPTQGSFTYDSAANNGNGSFSNFTVTWQGRIFDVTSAANSGPGSNFPCLSQVTGNPAKYFALLTSCQSQTFKFHLYFTNIWTASILVSDFATNSSTNIGLLLANNVNGQVSGGADSVVTVNGFGNNPTPTPISNTGLLTLAGTLAVAGWWMLERRQRV